MYLTGQCWTLFKFYNEKINIKVFRKEYKMYLPFIGLEVGMLSMFYEYVFVNQHIGYTDQVPYWTYLAQLIFCHSAYGYDRLLDVQNNDTDNHELIDYVKKNTQYIATTILCSVMVSVLCLLQNEHTMYLIPPFLFSVFYYRDFKKQFPLLKPFFICTLIVVSSVIFPSIITQNNLSILNDISSLVPPFANLYSSSTYLDVIDYNLDKANNITTLPVLFGNKTALVACLTANVISLASHIQHANFYNHIPNYIFQTQNVLSGLTLFNQNQVDFRRSKSRNKNKNTTPKMVLKGLSSCRQLRYPLVSPFIPRCVPKLLV